MDYAYIVETRYFCIFIWLSVYDLRCLRGYMIHALYVLTIFKILLFLIHSSKSVEFFYTFNNNIIYMQLNLTRTLMSFRLKT